MSSVQQTTESIVMAAQLILASGSRSGLAAPLLEGYYLIGRHEECQIRPKSKSVSRRHCLIHNQNGVLRLFDLESTSGTHLDGQRIPAHQWKTLDHGMQIRCGKICFNVVHTPQQESDQGSAGSLVSGSAFDVDDIADFLSSADDEDREKRYASIRAGSVSTDSLESVEAISFEPNDTFEPNEVFDTDVGDDSELQTVPASKNLQAATESVAKTNSKTKLVKLPKAKKKRVSKSSSLSMPTFNFREGIGTLALAVVVALLVLAFFGHQLYAIIQGPEVHIVRGLD